MLIDELIEKLHELKREYGSQEVTLYTQRDAWLWEEYNVGEIYHDDGDNVIVIQGKGKTQEYSNEYSDEFDNADDFIESLLEQEE